LANEEKKIKVQRGGGNDAYTAVLGLAVLTLGATVALVCIYAQQMWGTIFTVVSTP